ncbi:rRNA maturation RNase YbeY [Halalkalibacillus sediminis]|uniref:Endoribonuclease YbeY n=1 Tax=Halalkalibacillus sediminis TaxID=2018042 RepID=A0A2I0QXH7_9BACI|nr:rRNA maturation RNase YbeY [Halalkalibacillus sediminis]PKR79025.1 rRNA maturation RNase YbeY [Halalkalibacillus sediminis]
MIIDFNDETERLTSEQLDKLLELLQFAGKKENVSEEAELSVTFVTDEEIQEINKKYRDKDKPTDVISFAMQEIGEEELEITGEDLPVHLGDIIVSLDRCVAQSEEYNHSFERELGFLAVHGLLHLLGYDHMSDSDEQKMFSRQEEVLSEYGLKRDET